MTYVDGFVLPVPKKNLAKYRKMAEEGRKMWMKAGALQYFECVGNDLHPKMPMKCRTFTQIAKAKKSDTVFFSFVVYRSRAHRDAVNKKVMGSMGDQDMKDFKMPFNPKFMAYGGFKTIVQG